MLGDYAAHVIAVGFVNTTRNTGRSDWPIAANTTRPIARNGANTVADTAKNIQKSVESPFADMAESIVRSIGSAPANGLRPTQTSDARGTTAIVLPRRGQPLNP